MTTLQEAAQRALAALEYHTQQTRPIQQTEGAIKALIVALANEPQAEPAATVVDHHGFIEGIVLFETFNREQLPIGTKLYTRPAPAEQPGAVGLSEREAFEKWAGKPQALTWNGVGYDCKDGWENSYAVNAFCAQWLAWQARAALAAAQPATAGLSEQAVMHALDMARTDSHKQGDRALFLAFGRRMWSQFEAQALAAAQPVAAGWLPIETAPRQQGIPIIVSWPVRELDDDDMPTGPILRRVTLITEMNGDQWLDPDVCNASGAWFGDEYAYAEQPDLWQPLPPPPAATQGAKT